MSEEPVIVLGGGGHARVLIDTLIINGANILGVCAPKAVHISASIPYLGTDDAILAYAPNTVRLVNGVGSVGPAIAGNLRRGLYERFIARGYRFAKVIHPSAIISCDVNLACGVQVMAGAVIQCGTSVGENSIINTKVSLDHDCVIASHVHVAPGCTLSGNVALGDFVHVGTGGTLIQGVQVGRESFIAAGAVVIRNIPECVTAVGVPAQIRKH